MRKFSATLPQLISNDIGLNSRHSVGVLTLGRGTTSEYFQMLGYCLCTNIAIIMSASGSLMKSANYFEIHAGKLSELQDLVVFTRSSSALTKPMLTDGIRYSVMFSSIE